MIVKTTVRFYKGVPLSLSSNDIRYFTSRSQQSAYFNNRLVREVNALSHVRVENGTVDVEVSIDTIKDCNYISIENKGHQNRTYYGFITNVSYISEKNTRVSFELDQFQTYMTEFDISGTVEREHCNYNETNTIPEEIDEGDLIAYETTKLNQFNERVKIAIIGTTVDLMDPVGYGGGTLGAVNQPYKYYVLGGNNNTYHINGEKILGIDTFFENFSRDEKMANKVAFSYVTDHNMFNFNVVNMTANSIFLESTNINVVYPAIGTIRNGIGEVDFSGIRSKTYEIDNSNMYSGDLRKLNYYPFTQYKLYTPTKIIDLKPELLPLKFTIRQSVMAEPSPVCELTVLEYKNENALMNSAVYPVSANIPVVSEDVAVLMQHQTGIDTDRIVQSAGLAGLGILLTGGAMAPAVMAGVGSGIASGIGEYFSRHEAIKKSKQLPNHESGSVGKLINMARRNDPMLVKYKVTEEYEEMISNHFRKYGWKVLRHKKPNLKTRKSFNYVKMVDCVVKGNLTQSAIEDITRRFKEGVTLWHVDDVGNYNLPNELL